MVRDDLPPLKPPPPWNTPSSIDFSQQPIVTPVKQTSRASSIWTPDYPGLSPPSDGPSPPSPVSSTEAPWTSGPWNAPIWPSGSGDYGVPASFKARANAEVADFSLTYDPYFADEDLVLKRSSSQNITSGYHGNRSDSVITNPYEVENDENVSFRGKNRKSSDRNWKYSPTPSYKRKTAERLLKEHGSPPGIRVTCGGRIVPDSLPQLSSPVFAYHQFNSSLHCGNGGFNSNQTRYMSSAPTGFIPMSGQVGFDTAGKLCQWINGRAEPIQMKHGSPNYLLPPITTDEYSPFAGFQRNVAQMSNPSFSHYQPSAPVPASVSNSKIIVNDQIRLLKQQRTALDQELRQLEKESALPQSRSLPQAVIVEKRVKLITKIDSLRKEIKSLEESNQGEANSKIPAGYYASGPMECDDPQLGGAFAPLQSAFPEYLQGSLGFAQSNYFPQDGYMNGSQTLGEITNHGLQIRPSFSGSYDDSYHGVNALQNHSGNAGLGINNVFVDLTNTDDETSAPNFANEVQSLRHAGSVQPSGRRSHAIQIKNPNHCTAATQERKTSLDPTSPSYVPTPGFAPNSPYFHISPTGFSTGDTSFAPSPALVAEVDSIVGDAVEPTTVQSSNCEKEQRDHKNSSSSATTADFFPHNTSEYSTKSHNLENAADLSDSAETDAETTYRATGTLATPRKSPRRYAWHSSPAYDQPGKPSNDEDDSGDGHRHRAPSNRPTAPPPSVDCDDICCDMEFINATSFHHTPDKKSVLHHSTPLVTPKQDTKAISSPYWKSSPAVGDPQQNGGRSASLTPISRLLQGTTEKIINLPDPDANAEYVRGFQDALKQCGLGHGNSSVSSKTYTPVAMGSKVISRVASVSSMRGIPSSSPVKVTAGPKDLASNFMSKPNVTVDSLQERQVGTQTSSSVLRKSVPAPISIHNQFEGRLKRCLPLTPGHGYDHQRYNKAKISVNASTAQAHGVFQYDGSADDTTQDDTNHISVKSPSGKRSKTGDAPRSPIRERASAAYAKVNKLLPSPKSQEWRNIWKKRFTDLKMEEEQEIEDYKLKNPIRDHQKQQI